MLICTTPRILLSTVAVVINNAEMERGDQALSYGLKGFNWAITWTFLLRLLLGFGSSRHDSMGFLIVHHDMILGSDRL